MNKASADSRGVGRLGRLALYGLLGWCTEVVFSGVTGYLKGGNRRLPARTSLWMFVLYGLAQPLFEPVHDTLRGRVPTAVRGLVYGAGFHATEYATGWVLRRLLGQAPWDYSEARLQVNGLIRLDYFPLWAAAGLGLEWVHDRLRAG